MGKEALAHTAGLVKNFHFWSSLFSQKVVNLFGRDEVLIYGIFTYTHTHTHTHSHTHRQSPDGIAGTWWLVVRVRDGDGAPWEELHSCSGCYFQYRDFDSPRLEDLAPFAGEPC